MVLQTSFVALCSVTVPSTFLVRRLYRLAASKENTGCFCSPGKNIWLQSVSARVLFPFMHPDSVGTMAKINGCGWWRLRVPDNTNPLAVPIAIDCRFQLMSPVSPLCGPLVLFLAKVGGAGE